MPPSPHPATATRLIIFASTLGNGDLSSLRQRPRAPPTEARAQRLRQMAAALTDNVAGRGRAARQLIRADVRWTVLVAADTASLGALPTWTSDAATARLCALIRSSIGPTQRRGQRVRGVRDLLWDIRVAMRALERHYPPREDAWVIRYFLSFLFSGSSYFGL